MKTKDNIIKDIISYTKINYIKEYPEFYTKKLNKVNKKELKIICNLLKKDIKK